MIIFEVLFWTSGVLILYVFFGYPVLLMLLGRAAGKQQAAKSGLELDVTLVISAYNEESVIAEKIENSLTIDYPKSHLQIIVVSDASDDETENIVRRYENQGVELLRMERRGGKTLGLNEAVGIAAGDIIVFSDANAMYFASAIRNLVRNFSDESVGAVVGESTYADVSTGSETSESLYWRYEAFIKRLETKLGSVVGGDGAIYAVRKGLYKPMRADALSDFVNPLQVVEQGKRCVYEPAAVSVESAAESFDKEYARKVRIVNRAWRAMLSMSHMLNPFKHGLFAFEFISHKLLRWVVPFMLIVLFLANMAILGTNPFYRIVFFVQCAFYLLALSGFILRGRHQPMLLYIPFYFCLVNFASLRGMFQAFRGATYTTWSTPRG